MSNTGTKAKYVGRSMNFYDTRYNNNFPSRLFADCPLQAYFADPSIGHYICEDFNNNHAATMAGYTVTQATQGTFALTDAAGGVALVDSGSDTATQGANVQKIGECFLPAAGKDIWYEGYYKVVDTYDKAELFIGLSETDTAIIDTSANASANHIGWQCVTDNGILLFSAENATVGATLASNTIAEDTWVKLGFKVNGITSIEHWVNDVKLATTHVTANIPVTELTPSWVCQSGGTNDPILHIDWYRCFQLR